MKTKLAVLAAALLCTVAAPQPASATTIRGVIHRIEARVEGEIIADHVREASREWKQLPQAELACADQVLRERGQSVEGLARRGVSPSNPRLAELRKQCSGTALINNPVDVDARLAPSLHPPGTIAPSPTR